MLLLSALLVTYFPCFSGGWHYDDHPNILDNPNVHLRSWDTSAIRQTFFWQDDHPGARPRLQRPLAYFSFAINWYFGQDRVCGYHIVNFMIHFVTAGILYLVCRQLVSLPRVGGRSAVLAHPAACLAALFWAVHPVHVTAVTYIVQRMASMAGMFTIICIYAYLQGRLSGGTAFQTCCRFGAAAICAGLAISTKENAALLPISILLLEMLIIQHDPSVRAVRPVVLIAVALVIFATISVLIAEPAALLNGYGHRPYTPVERVLTESRVILFYLKLLFYPLLSGFTLIHDVQVSTSLWSPWTTSASIFCLVVSAVWAVVWLAHRHPLAALGILFFLANHAIEASFIPLELVYEHRNYIPSMFIFIFPAMLIVRVFMYFQYNRCLQTLMALSGALIIATVGHTTFAYNRVFISDLHLWRDNALKAPGLSVVQNNYGTALMRLGLTGKAVSAFKQAIRQDRYFNLTQRGLAHYNLGLYYENVAGDDVTALACFKEAIRRAYSSKLMGAALAMSQLRNGELKNALTTIERGLAQWPEDPAYLTALATLQIIRHQWLPALETIHRLRRAEPLAAGPFGFYGDVYGHLGDPHKAIFFWNWYARCGGRRWVADLALVNLYHQTGQEQRAQMTAGRLSESEEYRNWLSRRVSKSDAGILTELITPELKTK